MYPGITDSVKNAFIVRYATLVVVNLYTFCTETRLAHIRFSSLNTQKATEIGGDFC